MEMKMNGHLLNETDSIVVETEVREDLVDKSFFEIMECGAKQLVKFHGVMDIDEVKKSLSNTARKGGLGNLLEECYFGYQANGIQAADLEASGVEVKATPFEKRKNGNGKRKWNRKIKKWRE